MKLEIAVDGHSAIIETDVRTEPTANTEICHAEKMKLFDKLFAEVSTNIRNQLAKDQPEPIIQLQPLNVRMKEKLDCIKAVCEVACEVAIELGTDTCEFKTVKKILEIANKEDGPAEWRAE